MPLMRLVSGHHTILHRHTKTSVVTRSCFFLMTTCSNETEVPNKFWLWNFTQKSLPNRPGGREEEQFWSSWAFRWVTVKASPPALATFTFSLSSLWYFPQYTAAFFLSSRTTMSLSLGKSHSPHLIYYSSFCLSCYIAYFSPTSPTKAQQSFQIKIKIMTNKLKKKPSSILHKTGCINPYVENWLYGGTWLCPFISTSKAQVEQKHRCFIGAAFSAEPTQKPSSLHTLCSQQAFYRALSYQSTFSHII